MKWTAFGALVFVLGFTFVTHAAVDVTAFRIEETRTVEFLDDKVSRTPPRMSVTLSLHGPEAEASIRYGNLKLEEAVDDLGSSLLPAGDRLNGAAPFKDYSNSFFRNHKFGGKGQSSDPQVELTLALAKRGATKIARLHGSLMLSDQGTIQSVELLNLKEAGKKTLAFPPDAHLGVEVDAAGGEGGRAIGIQITGDESALESIEVFDAAGHKVASGMSKWTLNGGPVHKTIQLERPVDNTMKLVAKYALNRKLTTVQFDLKDIALP